jgi:hypothetical protein
MSGKQFDNMHFEDMFGDEDLFDLVDKANKSFEDESLNAEPIHIRNVDNYMQRYKTSVFRTKKSMKIIKKRVTFVKNLKELLKEDLKEIIRDFNSRKMNKN